MTKVLAPAVELESNFSPMYGIFFKYGVTSIPLELKKDKKLIIVFIKAFKVPQSKEASNLKISRVSIRETADFQFSK